MALPFVNGFGTVEVVDHDTAIVSAADQVVGIVGVVENRMGYY